MEILFLIIGIVTGSVITWLLMKLLFNKKDVVPKSQVDLLQTQIGKLNIEKAKVEERASMLDSNYKQIIYELSNERKKVVELTSELSSAKVELDNLNEKLKTQKEEIADYQTKFASEFKNLANEIFEDKSKKFTEQNKENINAILSPLQQKIREFELKVSDAYINESKERASLSEQIKQLTALNQQITREAENLTSALKGQSKTQGDWGELILEEILEKSGLVKGTHYSVQQSLTNPEGKVQRPDVIINLPENKSIIIDSKVSLTAYTDYCNTENNDHQKILLSKHLESLRKHIKELSEKKYQNIYELQSLDFVLMFIPVEPAFVLAVKNDPSIFNEAFERRIVLVTTSTLLATLSTIASIWRQENQNKNALEIAKKSGDLYDKFVSFVEDINAIGEKILATQKAYDDAKNKLFSGRGNLIKRAEELKMMGAKTNKALNQSILNKALEAE